MSAGVGRGANLSRALALVLVAAIGWAGLSARHHETAVRHVRCAAHGDLIHVRALRARAATSPSARIPIVAPSAPGGRDEHEHCALVFATQPAFQPTVVLKAIRFAPPAPFPAPHVGAAPRSARACVLFSAPKTSPPWV